MTVLGPTQVATALRGGLVQPGVSSKPSKATWDIDLRLGPEAFVSSGKAVSKLAPGDTVTVEPGEFAILLTEEVLAMPDDVAGFISLKFDQKKRGLTNISGFHVDPGYKGRLIFSVYNAGPHPIPLRRGEPVFMMILARLESKAPRSPDQKSFDSIPSALIASAMGPPVSVHSLTRRVEEVQREARQRLDKLEAVNTGRAAIRSERKRIAIDVVLVVVAAGLSALATWLLTKP